MRARSHRSMRKNEEPHFLHLHVVSKLGRASVENAHCSCKGGSGGHCNYLFALLFQLNDFSCSRVNTVPSGSSCTSRRQEWHILRAASICPMPVMATHYARAGKDRGSRKRKPVLGKLYDARNHSAHEELPTDFVMKEVAYLQSKTNPHRFLSTC